MSYLTDYTKNDNADDLSSEALQAIADEAQASLNRDVRAQYERWQYEHPGEVAASTLISDYRCGVINEVMMKLAARRHRELHP